MGQFLSRSFPDLGDCQKRIYRIAWSLDFIENAPIGFLDQSDAVHPAGFPIMTILFRFKAQ